MTLRPSGTEERLSRARWPHLRAVHPQREPRASDAIGWPRPATVSGSGPLHCRPGRCSKKGPELSPWQMISGSWLNGPSMNWAQCDSAESCQAEPLGLLFGPATSWINPSATLVCWHPGLAPPFTFLAKQSFWQNSCFLTVLSC